MFDYWGCPVCGVGPSEPCEASCWPEVLVWRSKPVLIDREEEREAERLTNFW